MFVATNSWIIAQLSWSIVRFRATPQSVIYLGSVIIWVSMTREDLNYYIPNIHKFVYTAYGAVFIPISFLGYFTSKMVPTNVRKANKPTDIQTLTPPRPPKKSLYKTENCVWLVAA